MPVNRDAQGSVKDHTGTINAKLLRFLGGALIGASVLGFILGFAAFQVARVENPGALWKLAGIGLPLVFLAMFAGEKCYKLGKHRGALSAEAAIADDPRPPVVYLRSFQDDPVAAQGSEYSGGGALWSFVGSIATEEEQFAAVMKEFGPFIAIGKPGEELPKLGAARMYVEDSEWKDTVLDLMSRAKLVVLRAGKTEGLWWEVATASKIVRPEGLLFLLPYDAKQYETFRVKAEKYLPCRLPDYPGGKIRSAGSIWGILYFEPDWRPHFLELKGFDRAEITRPWVRMFKTTLEPVFKQLQVAWEKPKSNLYWIVALVVLGPILVLGLLALIVKLAG
jgi:hypothetical protein